MRILPNFIDMLIIDVPKQNAVGLVSSNALKVEWHRNEVANQVQALTFHHMLREYRQPINDPMYEDPDIILPSE